MAMVLLGCSPAPAVTTAHPSSASAAPSSGPSALASASPVAPAEPSTSIAAPVASPSTSSSAPAKTHPCFCFDWVHLADFGKSCHPTKAVCEAERAKGFPKGRGDTTKCALTSCTG